MSTRLWRRGPDGEIIRAEPAPEAPEAPAGGGARPRGAASGVYGSAAPAATTSSVVTASGKLGRLRHGRPAVRITNSTSVCVASDSRNQPV